MVVEIMGLFSFRCRASLPTTMVPAAENRGSAAPSGAGDSTAQAQPLLKVIRANADGMHEAREGGGNEGQNGRTSGNARPQAETDGTEFPCVRLLVPAG